MRSTVKFIHLTEQPLIARIKKRGIRFGNGRRGRGVYAVPLMVMRRKVYREDEPHLPSDPVSSSKLWQWLAGLGDRHRHCAAIVFETTCVHWPAQLYIELDAKTGHAWLDDMDPREVEVTASHLEQVREAHAQWFMGSLQITVNSSAGLGQVMHALHSHGYAVWDGNDESIEIVFPRPIPARSIVRVIPRYQNNKQFRQVRDRRPADPLPLSASRRR